MKARAVGVVIAALVVAIGFGDVLVGRSLVPGDALARDPVFAGAFPHGPARGAWDTSGALVHYPAQLEAARQIRAGRLPLWNPRVGLGMPLLAEAHAAPLSPVLWPFVVWPGERAWSLGQLVRPFLMALGAWLLARRRGACGAGGALAAVTYALSGLAMSRFDLPTEGAAYALLPFVALAAWDVVDGRRGVALAALVGLAFLSCHPELAAVAIAGGLALGVGLACAPRPAELARAARAVVPALILGTIASAVVIVPLLAYAFGDGATYKTDATQAARFAGDLRAFPSAPELLRVGVAPLFCALVAALRGQAARRLLGLPVAALVLLFLAQGFLPAPWGALLPPRYALFVASLACALAAAEGLDALRATPAPRALAIAACATAVLWALADLAAWGRLHKLGDVVVGEIAQVAIVGAAIVFFLRRPRAAAWGVAAVTALTLAISARRVRLGAGAGIPHTPAAAALAAHAPVRVLGLGPWLDRVPLTPNIAGVFGLSDVRAVAAIAPARYRAFMSKLDGVRVQPTSTLLERADAPLLTLLGIDVIVARPEHFPATGWTETYRDERVVIGRRATPSPRAYAPAHLVTAHDARDAAARLDVLAADHALPATAVVEAPSHALAAANGRARVAITRDAPDEVTLAVDADADTVVILADAWASGWSATVDGAATAAWPANVVLRAAPVPAGRHTLVWRYRPVSARVGAWLSAAAWLTLAALALFRRKPAATSGRASA